jgi:hypothetical protein
MLYARVDSGNVAIGSHFEILRSVETEWGQALYGLCNCLTPRALIAQSLQSIIGAMQQRRSNSFIRKRFWKSVSVADDYTDRHCRRSLLIRSAALFACCPSHDERSMRSRMRLRSSGIGIGFSALTFAPPVLPSGIQIRENSAAATMRLS